jgi:hypothetical protein
MQEVGTLREFVESHGVEALPHALAIRAAKEFGRLVAVCLPPGALELVEREAYHVVRRALEDLKDAQEV